MISILKRLLKGSLTYGTAGFLQKIISFLLIPIYTRFLTTSDYGIVAIAATISSIFEIILGMGMRGAVVRHHYDYNKEPTGVREYLGTVFLFYLLISLPLVGALTIFGQPLFDRIFSEVPFHPYIRLSLWTAFFSAEGAILLGLYRAREQVGRYVSVQFMRFLVTLGVIIFFVVVVRQGALGKIKGGFYAGLAFSIFFLILTVRESKVCLSLPKLRSALAFGLPLVISNLTAWIFTSADRILLERFTSLSMVGLYNLGYKMGMVMSLIVTAINFAWIPIFYDTAKNKENAEQLLSRMFTLYTVVVSTLAIGIILFSREVILIMSAESFHAAHTVAPVIAVGHLFQGLYYMSVAPIFYKKKTHLLPLLTGVAAAINIGLNILWIPPYGMMGAAYATLGSFAVLFTLTHYFAQRYYRLPYNYRKVASMGLLVAGVYFVNHTLHFQGIIVPVVEKIGIVMAFLAGMFLLKVISVQELRRVSELFKHLERNGGQSEGSG